MEFNSPWTENEQTPPNPPLINCGTTSSPDHYLPTHHGLKLCRGQRLVDKDCPELRLGALGDLTKVVGHHAQRLLSADPAHVDLLVYPPGPDKGRV